MGEVSVRARKVVRRRVESMRRRLGVRLSRAEGGGLEGLSPAGARAPSCSVGNLGAAPPMRAALV
eukprot:scaffold29261_cov39-Isochrysis_galbana.AAC.1